MTLLQLNNATSFNEFLEPGKNKFRVFPTSRVKSPQNHALGKKHQI